MKPVLHSIRNQARTKQKKNSLMNLYPKTHLNEVDPKILNNTLARARGYRRPWGKGAPWGAAGPSGGGAGGGSNSSSSGSGNTGGRAEARARARGAPPWAWLGCRWVCWARPRGGRVARGARLGRAEGGPHRSRPGPTGGPLPPGCVGGPPPPPGPRSMAALGGAFAAPGPGGPAPRPAVP
jgi:hypothetical protein